MSGSQGTGSSLDLMMVISIRTRLENMKFVK